MIRFEQVFEIGSNKRATLIRMGITDHVIEESISRGLIGLEYLASFIDKGSANSTLDSLEKIKESLRIKDKQSLARLMKENFDHIIYKDNRKIVGIVISANDRKTVKIKFEDDDAEVVGVYELYRMMHEGEILVITKRNTALVFPRNPNVKTI